MQYNKLSALAQDTALKLEDMQFSPALTPVAAGTEQTFYTGGGNVSIAVFAAASYTLAVDNVQLSSGSASTVITAALPAGRHKALLTCANGLALICGGRTV